MRRKEETISVFKGTGTHSKRRDGRRMPCLPRFNLSGAAVYCLLMLCQIGCGESEDGSGSDAADTERVTNVALYVIDPDTLIQYSRLLTTARAWREVEVGFREGGTVAEIFAEMGDHVTEGKILARLEADLLEAASIEAEAGLKFQSYNYERAQRLYDEGSISEYDLYKAEYSFNQARSNAQTIRHRLKHAVLRAPYKGEVAKRTIEIGQFVQPGIPAFQIVQVDRIKAESWVPENEISDFSEGGEVQVRFDACPNEVFFGTVGRVGPAADSAGRVFPMEIHMDNVEGQVRPGMIGRLKAVRRIYREVVVIPREAVLEREEGPAVFVVNNDVSHLRHVTLGAAEGARVIVENGLDFEDQIVVKGGRYLIDGDRVKVMEVIVK